MRQVFLEKGLITVQEVCQPMLDDYAVLVSVHYSCISSGTELSTIDTVSSPVYANMSAKIKKIIESLAKNGYGGTKALIKARLAGTVLPLGYSCSGRVIAVGSKIRTIKAGDWVACAGAGFAHHADIVCVPENLVVVLKDEKNLRAASMTTICAIALQGLRRADVQLGETVAVVGLGLLGQLTVQLAKLSGCRVIGVDVLVDRLQYAQACGADLVLNPQEQDVVQEIAVHTDRYGADVTIITAASSSDTIMQQAMQVTRKKGKVVIVGDVGLKLERSPWYQKELDVLMSNSYGPGRYDASYELYGQDYPFAFVRWTENRNMQVCAQLLTQNTIELRDLVGNVPVQEAVLGYDSINEKRTLGVIIAYGSKEEEQPVLAQQPVSTSTVTFMPAHKDTIRVGFVGAGGFAKIKLMPLVAKLRSTAITAVVDVDNATAINMARTYGAARALTHDEDLFKEDLVDAVVIASPHKYHADHVLRALHAGKAVFVEKPLATTFEQHERIKTFLAAHPQAPCTVDFNRSYAPMIQTIKKEIATRRSPLVIHYRMNAGFIPKDHWVQTDIGAGRIIGEACHIVDLFCELTNATPMTVSVETIRPLSDMLFATDNFSAQIGFSDGSLATLLYTALGHHSLSKERMELFYDSKAIIMDDYRMLQGYGLPSSFNRSVTSADKGHEALLQKFFEALRSNKPMPISIERLNAVTELTLVIDQLACQGGGEREISF